MWPPEPDDPVREFCLALICDHAPSARALRDPEFADEVRRRMDQVGIEVGVVDGRAYAVARDGHAGGYSEPQIAVLAICAIELLVAPAPGGPPRLTLEALHARLSGHGWSKAWLRRAVLGPLERDGYLRVVAPGQRRADVFIEPGVRLHLLDTRALARALDAIGDSERAPAQPADD